MDGGVQPVRMHGKIRNALLKTMPNLTIAGKRPAVRLLGLSTQEYKSTYLTSGNALVKVRMQCLEQPCDTPSCPETRDVLGRL
jgi:hypothetical protein